MQWVTFIACKNTLIKLCKKEVSAFSFVKKWVYTTFFVCVRNEAIHRHCFTQCLTELAVNQCRHHHHHQHHLYTESNHLSSRPWLLNHAAGNATRVSVDW